VTDPFATGPAPPPPEEPDQPEQRGRPEQPAEPGGEALEDASPPTPPVLDLEPHQQLEPLAALQTELDERTRDLQRLQAEYVNYKRRVERDRDGVRDAATAGVLTAVLPVLDDVDRARQHGELTGGFKAVAESLERTVAALGLIRFGEPGEAFDPRIHEALMHDLSDDVEGPTARAILQPGYRVGDRVVRPARVSVVEPSAARPADQPSLDEPASAGRHVADAAGPAGGEDETGQ